MLIIQELHTKSAFLCCVCFAMFVILRDQYKRLASAALSMLMGCFCPRRTHTRKVFVSNLAYEVSWQDLKDHMRSAGNVIRADVIVGPDGRSKGLGTVEFSKPYEVCCWKWRIRLYPLLKYL